MIKTVKKIKKDAKNKNLGKPKIQIIIKFVTGELLIDLGIECNHTELPDLID